MTFKGFISTAKGINDGKDFDVKFMQDLFSSISKSPIAMHDIEKRIKKKKQLINLTLKNKLELFKEETKEILRKSH